MTWTNTRCARIRSLGERAPHTWRGRTVGGGETDGAGSLARGSRASGSSRGNSNWYVGGAVARGRWASTALSPQLVTSADGRDHQQQGVDRRDREATRGRGLADATEVCGCHWDQANDASRELNRTGVAERGGMVHDLMQRQSQAVQRMGRIDHLDHGGRDHPASIVGSLLWPL
jgi:hypothetical protein